MNKLPAAPASFKVSAATSGVVAEPDDAGFGRLTVGLCFCVVKVLGVDSYGPTTDFMRRIGTYCYPLHEQVENTQAVCVRRRRENLIEKFLLDLCCSGVTNFRNAVVIINSSLCLRTFLIFERINFLFVFIGKF